MRRRLTWLVALPSMLAGTEAAHALAYRIVFPQSHVRVVALAISGHGYLAWLPLVLALTGAAALVGLGAAALDAARGRTVGAVPALAFALLPPLAFALQELLELSLHTGTLAWHVFEAPTFLPGLALQLPFAVLAYIAARLLLRAAVRLGKLLAHAPRLRTVAVYRNDCDLLERRPPMFSASPRAPPLTAGI
jgi:hypothetical protein